MRIFSVNGDKLTEVTEQQFPLESEIQRLTEANLHDLFELDLVNSEFELRDLRIDKKLAKEIKVYSEEDHLRRVNKNIKELYLDLKNSILNSTQTLH